MTLTTLLFVSKRLQIVVAALICLGFVQLVQAAGEASAPATVRVAIAR